MLYHSLTDAILYLQQQYPIQWVVVETPPGARADDIYNSWKRTLLDYTSSTTPTTSSSSTSTTTPPSHNIRLAIFDHISSKPSVWFPATRICQLCQQLKIPTLVDGAHIPGSAPSQLLQQPQPQPPYNNSQSTTTTTTSSSDSELDSPPVVTPEKCINAIPYATFYAVTFHKWVNTPRGGGAGGIYVNRLHTTSTTYNYETFIDISAIVVHGGWADQPQPQQPQQHHHHHHQQQQQQQQQQQSTTIGMPSPSKYLMSNKNLPKDVLIKIQELTKGAPHIRDLHSSATPQERYNLENRIYNHFTQPRINFITELEDIITVNNINNYTKQEIIDWIPKLETSNRTYIVLLLFLYIFIIKHIYTQVQVHFI